jgi:hypothetical protein
VSASGCVCLPFFFCGLGVGGATQLLPGSINLEMGRLLYRVARYCYTSISCVVRGEGHLVAELTARLRLVTSIDLR